MKLLIAHSDAALRRRVAELLEPFGDEVLTAADAEQALEVSRRALPDVVLLEAGFAAVDQGSVLDLLKRDIDLFRTAVVVLDRALDLDAILDALGRGAQDVLPEPVGAGELVARIRAAERTKTLQEELVRQSERFEGLVFADELTGLYNRRFLLTQLFALVSGAQRHGRELSLVMVDVDRFKRVNDVHGHAVGDVVLRAVAGTLRDRLRHEDWAGRLGGEEFLALLPDDGPEGAAVVAEGLRRAVEDLEVDADTEDAGLLRVTVSAGCATLEPGEPAEDLLRRADEALFRAKRAGRNRIRSAASLPDRT